MAEFKPFNYAEAVQSGQQVAANALKLREGVRGVQGQNVLSDVASRGLTGVQKYNALQQAGRPDLAQAERVKDIQESTLKEEWTKSQLEGVYDQATYDAMVENVESAFGERGAIKKRFGESYTDAKTGLDQLLGREKEDTVSYGDFIEIPGQPNFVGQKDSKGKWINIKKKTDITDTVSEMKARELSKGMTTHTQKKMGGALNFRDQLSNLYKFSKKHENLHDVGSYLTQAITNYAEKFGLSPPEEWKKETSNWNELNNRTRTVVDAIRAETTKSAASFKELDQFLKPRTPQSDDGLTKFNAKMKGLLEYEESTTIRTKMLLERGFTFGGRVGKGENSQVLYSDADGNLRPIEQIMPLEAVPTHNERRAEILKELAGGRRVKDIPPDEMKQLKLQTISKLKAEGYNTVIYGQ